MPETDFLSPGDAARYLGVSVKSLQRWEKAGKLSAVRTLGNHRRFRLADLDAVLTRNAAPSELRTERQSA